MKREQISIASTYFYPDQMAAANRLYALACVLSEEYDVHVYTATENPEEGRRAAAEKNVDFKVHYVEKKTFSISNFFVRFFREIGLSKRVFEAFESTRRCSKGQRPVLMVSAPSIFLIPYFARKSKAHFLVADVRDLMWEYLLQGGVIHKLSGALFKKMVLRALRKFHLITVTNESEYRYFQKYFPEKPLLLVSNGIERERFEKIKKKMSVHSSEECTVSYIGNVGIPQNLESLLHIAQQLRDVKFVIAGGGSDLGRLIALAEKMNLENVEFTGYVKWERVLEIYASSDILYAKLDPSYIYAVPSKLYEYLSTGAPVVYEGAGAAAELLRQFNQVFIVENGDSKGLLKAVNQAREVKGLSQANREMVQKNYLRDDIFREFAQKLAEYRNRKL